MKRFIIDGPMDNELAEKFVAFVNTNPTEEIKIYLTSGGGTCHSMTIIADIINSAPNMFSMLSIDYIYSCAFILFFKAKCKREAAIGTLGMSHITWREMKMMATGIPRYDSDVAAMKADKLSMWELKELLEEICVSDRDQKKIMKG